MRAQLSEDLPLERGLSVIECARHAIPAAPSPCLAASSRTHGRMLSRHSRAQVRESQEAFAVHVLQVCARSVVHSDGSCHCLVARPVRVGSALSNSCHRTCSPVPDALG